MNDTCLICDREMSAEELACCARRREDKAPVCATCTKKLKSGNRDALDKWFDRRPVCT